MLLYSTGKFLTKENSNLERCKVSGYTLDQMIDNICWYFYEDPVDDTLLFYFTVINLSFSERKIIGITQRSSKYSRLLKTQFFYCCPEDLTDAKMCSCVNKLGLLTPDNVREINESIQLIRSKLTFLETMYTYERFFHKNLIRYEQISSRKIKFGSFRSYKIV